MKLTLLLAITLLFNTGGWCAPQDSVVTRTFKSALLMWDYFEQEITVGGKVVEKLKIAPGSLTVTSYQYHGDTVFAHRYWKKPFAPTTENYLDYHLLLDHSIYVDTILDFLIKTYPQFCPCLSAVIRPERFNLNCIFSCILDTSKQDRWMTIYKGNLLLESYTLENGEYHLTEKRYYDSIDRKQKEVEGCRSFNYWYDAKGRITKSNLLDSCNELYYNQIYKYRGNTVEMYESEAGKDSFMLSEVKQYAGKQLIKETYYSDGGTKEIFYDKVGHKTKETQSINGEATTWKYSTDKTQNTELIIAYQYGSEKYRIQKRMYKY